MTYGADRFQRRWKMYWADEYHSNDRDVKHLHAEFLYVAGIFSVVVWGVFIVANLL